MENNVEEPRIVLGKYQGGVLEIRDGLKKLSEDSLDDEYYEGLKKVIFPASLQEVEGYLFSNHEELEVLDFSKVTKLRTIPEDFVACETKIKEFIIPMGVTEVGDEFIRDSNPGTKIFVPSTVTELGSINSNNDNDQIVYLFASGVGLESVEGDIHTLYVLTDDYEAYAEQLQEMDSEARLREMPEEMMDFYSNHLSKEPVTLVEEKEPETEIKQAPTPQVRMAAGMPEEFINQVQEYLTDGFISEKERAVLLRKAEKLGMDVDEADCYIDAQEQKVKITKDVESNVKPGRVCPFCEKSIPQGVDRCPCCNTMITDENIEEFNYVLDKLTGAVKALKSENNAYEANLVAQRYARKAKAEYPHSPKILKLLEEVEKVTESEQKTAVTDKKPVETRQKGGLVSKFKELYGKNPVLAIVLAIVAAIIVFQIVGGLISMLFAVAFL